MPNTDPPLHSAAAVRGVLERGAAAPGGGRADRPVRRGRAPAGVPLPNTAPPLGSAAAVREVLELGATAPCDVRVAGAITRGRLGKELAPLGEMADLGVRLFTDDGDGVQNARLMRRAFEYASALGVTLAQHCEDKV